jgi:hypothetical protein
MLIIGILPLYELLREYLILLSTFDEMPSRRGKLDSVAIVLVNEAPEFDCSKSSTSYPIGSRGNVTFEKLGATEKLSEFGLSRLVPTLTLKLGKEN